MPFASDYPLLDVFWSILWFFLFFVWIFLLIFIFFDIFRSHDMKGWAKALWIVGIIIFPLFGVLLYLIVRGASMHQRSVQQTKQQEADFRQAVREAAGSGTSNADELGRLADLRERGALSEEEFQQAKAKLLA
jgi:hypothetical protein